MDASRYMQRIKCEGPFDLDLSTLRRLQRANLLSIPFENLDIHFGTPIDLEVERIYQKIIEKGRGGFCYELNELFNELLRHLGYQTKRISARVYDQDEGYGKEYDHLALLVLIDEKEYLVDVGFGEFAFGPLELKFDIIQTDERGKFMFDHYDSEYLQINKLNGQNFVPEYIFRNWARELQEFWEMCSYHQTSALSHFTQKKLISRATEDGRLTLTDNMIKIKSGASIEEIILEDNIAFENALLKYFQIEL